MARSNVIRAEKRFRKKKRRSLQDLFVDDLERSGITPAVGKKLGFELKTSDEAWALLHPKNPRDKRRSFTAEGYWIPYYGLNGQRISFGRFRKLHGKWSDEDDGKQRYSSPVNSLPHLYIPWPITGGCPVSAVHPLPNAEAVRQRARRAARLVRVPAAEPWQEDGLRGSD